MMNQTLKRFYKTVDAAADELGGFAVRLDGRAVRSPAKSPLSLPTRGLAEAVAAEWQAQEETIVPDSMGLMKLSATAIDRVRPNRREVVADLAGYGGTDLLCYRADGPDALVARQAAAWQPMLDWADEAYGVRLAVTEGLMPIEQSAEALEKLHGVVDALDDFTIAALHTVVTVSSSLILGLAFVSGRLSAVEAFDLSQIDETFQAERWGEDAEAVARRTRLKGEMSEAQRFLALLNA